MSESPLTTLAFLFQKKQKLHTLFFFAKIKAKHDSKTIDYLKLKESLRTINISIDENSIFSYNVNTQISEKTLESENKQKERRRRLTINLQNDDANFQISLLQKKMNEKKQIFESGLKHGDFVDFLQNIDEKSEVSKVLEDVSDNYYVEAEDDDDCSKFNFTVISKNLKNGKNNLFEKMKNIGESGGVFFEGGGIRNFREIDIAGDKSVLKKNEKFFKKDSNFLDEMKKSGIKSKKFIKSRFNFNNNHKISMRLTKTISLNVDPIRNRNELNKYKIKDDEFSLSEYSVPSSNENSKKHISDENSKNNRKYSKIQEIEKEDSLEDSTIFNSNITNIKNKFSLQKKDLELESLNSEKNKLKLIRNKFSLQKNEFDNESLNSHSNYTAEDKIYVKKKKNYLNTMKSNDTVNISKELSEIYGKNSSDRKESFDKNGDLKNNLLLGKYLDYENLKSTLIFEKLKNEDFKNKEDNDLKNFDNLKRNLILEKNKKSENNINFKNNIHLNVSENSNFLVKNNKNDLLNSLSKSMKLSQPEDSFLDLKKKNSKNSENYKININNKRSLDFEKMSNIDKISKNLKNKMFFENSNNIDNGIFFQNSKNANLHDFSKTHNLSQSNTYSKSGTFENDIKIDFSKTDVIPFNSFFPENKTENEILEIEPIIFINTIEDKKKKKNRKKK